MTTQGKAWLGYKDGRLVAIELDPLRASETLADWEARGYHVEVLPKDDALARWRRVTGFATGLTHLTRAHAAIDQDAALAWRQQRADEAADARADTERQR